MKIGDSEDIEITRIEPNFDQACYGAHYLAVLLFGIDDDGHSSRVEGWDRSCCWIELDFVSYKRSGNSHIYKFIAKTVRSEEDEEDEDD